MLQHGAGQGERFGGIIGLESFNVVALRIASQRLGCQTFPRGYILTALSQARCTKSADQMWLMPPFLMDYGNNPTYGLAVVTAWFLAFMIGDDVAQDQSREVRSEYRELEEGELEEEELEEGELEDVESGIIDTCGRGADWVAKHMCLCQAAQQLPDHEGKMIQKAIDFVENYMSA